MVLVGNPRKLEVGEADTGVEEISHDQLVALQMMGSAADRTVVAPAVVEEVEVVALQNSDLSCDVAETGLVHATQPQSQEVAVQMELLEDFDTWAHAFLEMVPFAWVAEWACSEPAQHIEFALF